MTSNPLMIFLGINTGIIPENYIAFDTPIKIFLLYLNKLHFFEIFVSIFKKIEKGAMIMSNYLNQNLNLTLIKLLHAIQ
jgi:hypothetical protein